MRGILLALGVWFTAGVFAAANEVVVFESGPARVALIELYTSEGCSSCPPAERWLGELRHDSGLWREFVPVAFHVDYWDRLGWRDRFASPAYTERQYAYAEAWRSRSVYTPCFVRNGREWRDRDMTRSTGERPGNLKLTIDSDRQATAVFSSDSMRDSKSMEFTIVLLGAELRSDVRSGENAGRTLRHEFVALSLQTTSVVTEPSGDWVGRIELPDFDSLPAKPRAVAAWITRNGGLEPLQAVGGWLEW